MRCVCSTSRTPATFSRWLASCGSWPLTLAIRLRWPPTRPTRAYRFSPGPDGEVFSAWAADLLLSLRLGWERPVPLLMTKILAPSLRRGATGARPRPNNSGWPQAAAAAYALAAGDAHALTIELSRRAESFSLLRRNRAPSPRRALSSCCSVRIASRRRAPRNAPVFRIAPRVSCSTVWSTSAPCAKCRDERGFGFTGCDRAWAERSDGSRN